MRLFVFLLIAIQTAGVLATPSTYYWVDWNNGEATNPGYKTTGKITTKTSTVNVNFKSSADIAGVQWGNTGDINYYGNDSPTSPYTSSEVANSPSTADIIQLSPITTVTITFSTPVVNPVLAIMSTNWNTYEFNSDFKILSLSGQNGRDGGYWGNGEWSRVEEGGKYKLVTNMQSPIGIEPHGAIKLLGTFTTVSWTTTADEYWHGFTIGIKSTQGEALVNTGLGPAQGTVKCTSWGDPHVISFSGAHFDCHVAGLRNYYTTVSNGITTTVDTLHTALTAPGKEHIMVNSDVYVKATTVGEIHAQPNGQVFFTPAGGARVEITALSGASNTWTQIAPGFHFIRNPSGAANKFGVYVAAAQMTVYFQRGVYLGSPYWNVDIIAVRLNSDTGLCIDHSCNTPPPTPPGCPNGTPSPAAIEAACLAAVQSSANPLYTFCVADVSLACDLDVALTYTPPNDPPAPLTPNSPVVGDPQFVGLQGQSYQVHGADDTIFALLSTPHMQMNGLFTYIGVGDDCDYNHTACWTHPGTYISQLGFLVQHRNGSEDKLHIISGSHSQGLHVIVNGEKKSLSSSFYLGSSVRVHIKSNQHIHVHIHDLFIIDITNSDHFFNMAVQLLRRDWLAAGAKRVKVSETSKSNALSVYPSIELHGLLGITWRNVVYPHNRVYEGDVMDYAIDSDDMFDTDFVYTQYQVPKPTAADDDI